MVNFRYRVEVGCAHRATRYAIVHECAALVAFCIAVVVCVTESCGFLNQINGIFKIGQIGGISFQYVACRQRKTATAEKLQHCEVMPVGLGINCVDALVVQDFLKGVQQRAPHPFCGQRRIDANRAHQCMATIYSVLAVAYGKNRHGGVPCIGCRFR